LIAHQTMYNNIAIGILRTSISQMKPQVMVSQRYPDLRGRRDFLTRGRPRAA
jgi:hypothetical protein